MNSQQIIDQLPEQSKRMVLFSLVGSLNSTIINTATSLASRLERDGVDIKDYHVRDVETLMQEPDWRMDTLLDVRRTVSVAENLRDQLNEVSGTLAGGNELGTISEAINYRCNPAPVRGINRDAMRATLIAGRVIKKDAKDDEVELIAQMAEKRQAEDNIRSAERVAHNRGAIEWIIDHVFNPDTGFERPDNIEDLPKPLQATLFDAIRAKIEQERLTAIAEVVNARRRPRYTIADVTLLADCADLADELDAHYDEATID